MLLPASLFSAVFLRLPVPLFRPVAWAFAFVSRNWLAHSRSVLTVDYLTGRSRTTFLHSLCAYTVGTITRHVMHSIWEH